MSTLPEVLAVQCQLSSKDTQTEPFRSASTNTNASNQSKSRYSLPSKLRLTVTDGKVKLADDCNEDETGDSHGQTDNAGNLTASTVEYELRSAIFLRWSQLRSLLLDFYSTKKQFPVAAFVNSSSALAAFVKVNRAYIDAKRQLLTGMKHEKFDETIADDADSGWFRFVENRVAAVSEVSAIFQCLASDDCASAVLLNLSDTYHR